MFALHIMEKNKSFHNASNHLNRLNLHSYDIDRIVFKFGFAFFLAYDVQYTAYDVHDI